MKMPETLNARIALARGWRRVSYDDETQKELFYWVSSNGIMQAKPPDHVGTLAGVAELMAKLNEHAEEDRQYWWWGQNVHPLVDAPKDAFICIRHGIYNLFLEPWFSSDPDRPGDCVGMAYLSVFGKESDARVAAQASMETPT